MVTASIDDAHLLVAKSDAPVGDLTSSDESDDPVRSGVDDVADTVTTVETVDGALEQVSNGSIDCVVVGRRLADRSGLELVEAIRERDSTLPIVLAPLDGDESLASEAITAGVTEYAPADRSAEERSRTIERAIETGRRRHRRRSRARGFAAVFEDSEVQSWLLEPDGRVRRANERALEAVGATETDVVGRPFPDVSPWRERDDERAAIREAFEAAADGDAVRRELPWTVSDEADRSGSASAGADRTDGGRSRTLSVTVRPVRDGDGTVTSVLVRAEDVTERAGLERELRESEELHRVTLNNMTDTVLVTDDDGEFTYVCPNVHFIFGYDDAEIHEMGSIDELLGPGLFDRDELAEEGVLTNIECTATDKTGREHTLLVNVREVSIQGGTTLYSCRDVTKRKRREEALTALHRTTRRLLYAETDREIADLVVGDATDILDLEASGVYLFETDDNVLRPAAHSSGMAELHGPLSAERVGDENVPGTVFLEGKSQFFEDVTGAAALSSPTTDVRSAAFVPLGDHGVFVAGSSSAGEFDDVSRELTDLLAATAEAALDRVERERALRERDRELKRRNHQLTRLNRINELIREIDTALVQAETREEIERAVCDRLTAADRFSVAWIGASDGGGDHLEVRAYGGSRRGREYLDNVSLSLTGDAAEPAVRAATDREVTVVSNVVEGLRDERWRGEALAAEYQSVLGVPLSYDEFTYGVLTVYADRPEAFDDVTRTVFEELGETIASAIAAVERKSALLSGSGNRLEFAVRDDSFVFTRLAERADCTLSFDGGIQQHDDGATVFATVEGAAPADVVEAAAALVAVDDAQVVDAAASSTDEGEPAGGTVRLVLSRPFFALRLADHGIVLRRVEATPSMARVVVDVPSSVDARESADVVSSEFEDVDLRSKQTVDRTMRSNGRMELLDGLTDRQLEVVQLAYYGGYFESPRTRSGEDVAETLEISPAAFYQHVRTVQRKLFEALFDGTGRPADGEA
ncbi:bacterio-opsin activator domain-containing protein [Natrarchaeobius sp. A-rgal3]|uniref:bacterio-opsin activator domain-containing protein n=1 Tax=Natrarchaeobius versutus TaxID=1679078 RepID=UPI003510B3AE